MYRETLGKTIAMEGETKSKTVAKENKVRSHPGLPGSTRRVDRVSPGQLPSGFLPPPGPVPCPGRPGPGSTRRAGPGRVLKLWKILNLSSNFKRLIQQDPSTPSILYLLSSQAHIYDLDINKTHHENLKITLRSAASLIPDTRSP